MGDVPKVLICSKCQDPLLKQGEEDNEIVATPCGHVFHKTCVIEWCIAKCGGNGSGESLSNRLKRKMYSVYCPKPECLEPFTWCPSSMEITGLKHLVLDKGDDPRFGSVHKELENEKGVLENKREKLENENRQLAKRMITAEIKDIFLSDKNRLEDKFGHLKWHEITPEFQKELLGKLQISGRHLMNFDEFFPINSKALLRLIKAGENDKTLLQRIIEDYLEEKRQSKSNGKVVWEDLEGPLRQYLMSKLRKSCRVESLELVQLPLTSNILVHLITDKTENDIGYLGKIVTRHIDEMVNESLTEVKDLFKVALQKCINSEIVSCVEVDFLKPEALEMLVELGMLRKTESEFEAPYEFVHDSVKHCVIGNIMSKLMEKAKVSRINAFQLFPEGYANPLGVYFADYMSEEEENCLAFEEIDHDISDLIMILAVIRLPSLEPVIATLTHLCMYVRQVQLVLKTPQSRLAGVAGVRLFSLLHAAGIRGDLERVKCLLYSNFGFYKVLDLPRYEDLILSCVENTKDCTHEEIQQRKEIIKELLKLNVDLVKCDPPCPSLNVHGDLIKFLLEKGAEFGPYIGERNYNLWLQMRDKLLNEKLRFLECVFKK